MPDHLSLSSPLAASLAPHQLVLLRDLGALADERGAPAFLVGGAVRDVLLGATIDDLDIVIEGDAPALGRALTARFGGELVVHGEFGTANWQTPDGDDVDLVTARSEVYPEPAALPVVTPSDLGDDLARRDFTINAMAIALSPARWAALVDPFGGRADLDAGVVRVLHAGSFVDDPTRAWRAARFAGRLGFHLAPETLGVLRAARDDGSLSRLGLERLGNELKYVIREAAAMSVFELAEVWGLLGLLHPALQEPGLIAHLRGAREAAGELADEVTWLALSAAIPKWDRKGLVRVVPGGGQRRKRWLLSPPAVERAVTALAEARERSEAALAVYRLGEVERAYARGLVDEAGRGWLDWWEETGQHIRCALDGRVLMEVGVPNGPAVGKALHAARLAAWNGADAAEQMAAALRVGEGGG